MTGFVLHPEAYIDIDEILEFVADDDIDAADRLRDEMYAVFSGLVSFPHRGHRRPDLTSRTLRFHRVYEYLIAYAPDENPLLVVAVIHGRRSPRVMAAILRGRES